MNQTAQFRHSNVNNCIDKLCSEVCSFAFFQHRSGNSMSSVKRKLNVKSLGEKCQALRDLEKGPQTKRSVKNMMYPFVKPSSIEITNALNICRTRSWKRYARAFAKIRIIACA